MPSQKYLLLYIILGAMYLVVKIIFVAAGYLHLGAIAHGAIPAVLTCVAGVLAIWKSKTVSRKILWRGLLIALPVLSFLITPLFMHIKQGAMWLEDGRLQVLMIYEVLAVIQFIIAVSPSGKSNNI